MGKQLSCASQRTSTRNCRQFCKSVFYWYYSRQGFQWFFDHEIKRYTDDTSWTGLYIVWNCVSTFALRQYKFLVRLDFCWIRLRPDLSLHHTFHARAFWSGQITSYDRCTNGMRLYGKLFYAANLRIYCKSFQCFLIFDLFVGNTNSYGYHA